MVTRLWPGAWQLARRVWVVPDDKILACRFGPWVILGEAFMSKLTWPKVRAVVLHELGHGWCHQLCHGVVKSLAPALLPRLKRRLELQADDHAKRQGWGNELASALAKFQGAPQANGYPSIEERVRRLTC